MKKSKIIIPALGMLILSTAASVTGTVAWFTTVSSATANITSFAVRKLGGDLSYVVAAGTGTKKVDSSDTSSITLDGTSPALCDASFNHTTKHPWKANSTASAFTEITTENVANWGVTSVTPAQVTYYAVSWSYTFTYTFGGDSTAMNLYFDSAASTITPTTTTAAETGHESQLTYKGFRIAFLCDSSSRAVVWAKNQTSANCHYVTASNDQTGAYSNVNSTSAAGNLIDSSNMTAIPENSTGTISRTDYLGQFTTSVNTLTIKCVAWFEGTDPNVVNGAEMDSVAAALTFYTRPLAAA